MYYENYFEQENIEYALWSSIEDFDNYITISVSKTFF